MASIVRSAPFDSEALGLVGEDFSVTLTHNVALGLPMSPQSPANRIPYAVAIKSDAAAGLQTIVGFAWSLNGSLIPQVTVQLQSGSGTLNCVVSVLYKK